MKYRLLKKWVKRNLVGAKRSQGFTYDGSDSNVHFPTKQELIDTMLKGTTLWWERIDGQWACYWTDCKNVYNHVYSWTQERCLIKQYGRLLSFEEKRVIFTSEALLFYPQENGKFVVLREYEGGE